MFSFGESRTAIHIRPPVPTKSINERMKKYSPETMMISKAIGTNNLLHEGILDLKNEKDSRNWINLKITHNLEGWLFF